MSNQQQKPRLTAVSTIHYIKLVIRSVIFITVLVYYILYRTRGGHNIEEVIESRPII